MFRKNYFIFLALAALFLLSGMSLFAQSPIKGKVELKKADGTVVPVEGATISIYRTDSTMAKMASVKSDAQGMFASEAVPKDQNFALLVSAPDTLAALLYAKGGETANVSLTPGNGETPSDEEVHTAIKEATIDPNSVEGKKIAAEREKKTAEINAKNDKARASNDVLNRALKEGNTTFSEGNNAYIAKNYDDSIAKFGAAAAKYDEGYNAAPEFLGSAPIMLNNKGNALRLRGFSNYKKSGTDAANKATLMEAAKKDFNEALASHQKALAVASTAPATDTKSKDNKLVALSGIAESYRLLVGTRADASKTKELLAAANDYAAAETVAATKAKKLNEIADTFRLAGDSADSIPLYKKVLEVDPNNVDAIGGLGLSLYNEGAVNNNKEQTQEGLNLMKKFTEVAPDTHPEKLNIKNAVDYLINSEKMTPQKVTTTKKKS